MKIAELVRPNIFHLKPYASARHEFTGQGEVFLDANENPYASAVNRYPDPQQTVLKKEISRIKHIPTENIFLGNGSDEAIDLIIRIFCEPGKDEIMVLPPTYGMYQVSADIANIGVKKIILNDFFQPDIDAILNNVSANTKVLFLCSPNNPTGNLIRQEYIIQLIESFPGIVVIDEAYIDFCKDATCAQLIHEYPNLIVMQTLSKAWGMAAIRLGMAFTSLEIMSYFNKVKAPYNINILTQNFALARLQDMLQMENQVTEILSEKERLYRELPMLNSVLHVYPSDANFILVKMRNADLAYHQLVAQGVVVRNRSKEVLCTNCLRISIGTPAENTVLLQTLSSIS